MDRDIIISVKTVLFTVLLFFVALILLKLGPIFGMLLIATILVLALEPSVQFFTRKTFLNKPLPRGLAVAITYFLFVATLMFILTAGLPPVLVQAQKLLLGLSTQLKNIPFFREASPDFIPQLSSFSANIITFTYSVISNLFAFLSVLFISLYMSLDWENIKSKFISLFFGSMRGEVDETVHEIEASIGHWVKGQVGLMVFIGVMSFSGLALLGIDYPLALGLIAGLLEIVPALGPLISALLAAIVGFSISPVKGVAVVILFTFIQQTENNFLVPKIMQKVSGFSPLVIIIALLVGSEFFGLVGAVVAVPVMMISVIILKRFLRVTT